MEGWPEPRALSASWGTNGSWREDPRPWKSYISPSCRFGILQGSGGPLIRPHTKRKFMWYYLSCKPPFLSSVSHVLLSTQDPALLSDVSSQSCPGHFHGLTACPLLAGQRMTASSYPACLSHSELVDCRPSLGPWSINRSRKIAACFPHLKLIWMLWANTQQRPLSKGSAFLRHGCKSAPLQTYTYTDLTIQINPIRTSNRVGVSLLYYFRK